MFSLSKGNSLRQECKVLFTSYDLPVWLLIGSFEQPRFVAWKLAWTKFMHLSSYLQFNSREVEIVKSLASLAKKNVCSCPDAEFLKRKTFLFPLFIILTVVNDCVTITTKFSLFMGLLIRPVVSFSAVAFPRTFHFHLWLLKRLYITIKKPISHNFYGVLSILQRGKLPVSCEKKLNLSFLGNMAVLATNVSLCQRDMVHEF